jgi:HAD superfamily hydrolase (TIGR01490 family)
MFAKYYAFFDVDETLISGKSMFMFAEYCCAHLRSSDAEQRRESVAALRSQAQTTGLGRKTTNHEYYRRLLHGLKVADVMRLGEDWFREACGAPGFFVPSALAHVNVHHTRGGEVVLVSGSFEAALAPIARHIGASHILATRLVVQRGVFTGAVLQGCIGSEKADAISRFLDQKSVSCSKCYAYGDHLSDVDMLASVGYPIVVGNEAAKRSWCTISSTAMRLG